MVDTLPPPPLVPADEPEVAERRRARIIVPLLLLVGAVLVGAGLWNAQGVDDEAEPPVTRSELEDVLEDAFATTVAPPPLAEQVYDLAIPSLVVIQTERSGGDDENGIGSGVVVNADGQILTAHHVVEGADTILVTFSDGSALPAVIETAEPERDIAVLTPQGAPSLIVPAVLGGGVDVGQDVYALGNPLGLAGSISAGVVSGLGRTLPVDDDGTELSDLIQFDAAVNPGSSGGPLLDRFGRVAGIVTALVNPDGEDSFTGIGFAIPIEIAGGGAGAPAQ